jgi:hypothetical protein
MRQVTAFRHVRICLSNPPNSVLQYRFDAESSTHANGNWHMLCK